MSVSRALPLMRVLRLGECAVPLYDQLVLEEYLLRHTRDNWCAAPTRTRTRTRPGAGPAMVDPRRRAQVPR
jgi:hypothetical protein